MKRRLPTFLTGALTGALAVGLVTSALAASGAVRLGAPEIQFWGAPDAQTISHGETYEAENGAQVPAAVTYVDERGGGTTYVSLRKVAELLDAPLFWDEEESRILFAALPADMNQVSTEVGVDTPQNETYPTEPTLGVTAGGFTEVAPLVEKTGRETRLLEETQFSSKTGFVKQSYQIFEPYGCYVEFTVTNHGEPVTMAVSRPYHNFNGTPVEKFTTIQLGTGETVTRAFRMEPGTPYPTNYLRLDVDNLYHGYDVTPPVDITVSVTQSLD